MDLGTVARERGITRYPASLAQTRFWLLDALDPGTPALNVAVRWTILGPLTHAVAEAAWLRLIERHEVLRTAFHSEAGVPFQAASASVRFRLAEHDLTAMPEAERLATADRLGEEDARSPFVLEAAPLMRAALIRLEPGVCRMLLTLHHAVCDGWSIGVLAEEFTAAVAGLALPELPLQYGDYAEWQNAWLGSDALAEATHYWVRQLADLPYVAVPPDRDASERGAGAIASTMLPREVTDSMAHSAARRGCTPFAIAVAALSRMLHARTGAIDIAIGTQIAGRGEVELEPMVGCFINTLVLRLDLSGEPSWDALTERAAATVADALQHGDMPFESLIRTLNPPRAHNRTPLFSVNLIFQRSFVLPPPRAGITLLDMPSHSAGALYDLNFFMVERPGGWRASCEYDTALFDGSTVEAMLAEWIQALSGDPLPRRAADSVMQRLAAIWCEVLGVPAVAPGDSFFELGGHSLLAARLMARVEQQFGRRIGMAALFADPTLAGLAAHLEEAPGVDGVTVLNKAGGLTQVLALGPADSWKALSRALGPDYPFACLAAPASETVTTLSANGRLALIAAGADGRAALTLAQALQGEGRAVTLALLDPSLGRRTGLWSRLRRPSRPPRFDGRTIVFSSNPAAAENGGWAEHVGGELHILPLPSPPWEPAVARQLVRVLA